jgi:bifunctional non-homologous end joining protein LigD
MHLIRWSNLGFPTKEGYYYFEGMDIWVRQDDVRRAKERLAAGTADHLAVACAFDLLMHDGDDLRRQPLRERKLTLGKLLIRSRGGIQYVEHTEGHGEKLFEAVCDLGLEGIVSKRLTAVYRSGPSRTWIKVKNPKSPAATRAMDGTF